MARKVNAISPFNITALAFGMAFLYLPIVILVIYSFNASRLVTVWGGWSLRWRGRRRAAERTATSRSEPVGSGHLIEGRPPAPTLVREDGHRRRGTADATVLRRPGAAR